MAYRVTNTEHAGDKRSCASYCGHRADAKDFSRRVRRANGRALVRAELADLDHDPCCGGSHCCTECDVLSGQSANVRKGTPHES